MKGLAVFVCALVGTTALATPVLAGSRRQVDIPERLRGAEQAVVATVVQKSARYERNEYGDELIISHLVVSVEETLKGRPGEVLSFAMEGGTIGDLTLEVSDLPVLQRGDRAVLMLGRDRAGRHVPHLRGLGILKLSEDNTVGQSSLTLDMIREMARAEAGR
jgi:hypothetical protein